jgi:hypothetical protein
MTQMDVEEYTGVNAPPNDTMLGAIYEHLTALPNHWKVLIHRPKVGPQYLGITTRTNNQYYINIEDTIINITGWLDQGKRGHLRFDATDPNSLDELSKSIV